MITDKLFQVINQKLARARNLKARLNQDAYEIQKVINQVDYCLVNNDGNTVENHLKKLSLYADNYNRLARR